MYTNCELLMGFHRQASNNVGLAATEKYKVISITCWGVLQMIK
jgi:hypothetical protein